jgi:hypothetical protein
VASTILASVAPLARFIIAITSAFLLVRASVASFFGAAALALFDALASLAVFFGLRCALLFAGGFLRGACLWHAVCALFRDGGGFLVGFCVRHDFVLFCGLRA